MIIAEVGSQKLSKRNIPWNYKNKQKTSIKVKSGVPQGSVVSPILWNILYDEVLDLELTEGATWLAFADDLAVLIGTHG